MSIRNLIPAATLALSLVSAPVAAESLNPPPAAPFKGYEAYELKSMGVPADLHSSETGLAATAKIQEHLTGILAPVLAGWNQSVTGAWSFGKHDNSMLSRVVDLAANYCKANFDNAVGGPSGL
jgi:hypothetical protein